MNFDIHCYENSKKTSRSNCSVAWADASRGQEPPIGRSVSEEGTGEARLRSRQCRAVKQVTHMPGTSSPNSPFTTWTFATAFCPSPCAQAGRPWVPVLPSPQAPCGTQISARPSLCPLSPAGWSSQPSDTALPCPQAVTPHSSTPQLSARQPAPHLHTSAPVPASRTPFPCPCNSAQVSLAIRKPFPAHTVLPNTLSLFLSSHLCQGIVTCSCVSPCQRAPRPKLGLVGLRVPRP